MSSDIVHYLGRCIIRFMPSYGRFQYSWVLYHDYERSGRWDAVCISLRQNEMDQYNRGGWIRRSACVRVCMCVWLETDSLGRSERTTACGFKQCLSFCLSHSHADVFRRMHKHKHRFLIGATFWCRNNIFTQYISLWLWLFPPCIGYKLHEAIFLQWCSRQAGWSRSRACSHLSADLQAVCDRSLGAFSGCVLPSWEGAALWIHLLCHLKCSKQAAWLSVLWNWKIWAL